MFHQSGGCCDGSSPMCYPDGEFRTGDSDIHRETSTSASTAMSRCGCRSLSSSTGSTRTSPSTW
ncbi:DUF779 domain-containing protein [Nocardioides sp. B-3]|nr:DUF779 domain-containing protein [Nocardioides sp. B-3]UUZ61637.1 DUF779 domain-containing protein [Nocardioides sp. B-3]